jgi:hypothetical protein
MKQEEKIEELVKIIRQNLKIKSVAEAKLEKKYGLKVYLRALAKIICKT